MRNPSVRVAAGSGERGDSKITDPVATTGSKPVVSVHLIVETIIILLTVCFVENARIYFMNNIFADSQNLPQQKKTDSSFRG